MYLVSYLDLGIVWYGLLVVLGGKNDLKDSILILLHGMGRHIPAIYTNWCQLHRRDCTHIIEAY